MLREKFSELVSRLKSINENEMAKDVDEIIRSCGNYIERVNAMESCITVLRFTLDLEDYRTRLQELDKARKLSHNGLITNVKLLNRYCKLAEMDPIYDGDLDSRIQIAEFANRVVNEMFETRKL
jgi:hypothetical protein